MTQDMNHTITKVLKAMLVAMMMSLTGGNAIAQVKVKGNVFGGGNEADVQTNTEVNISAGSVEGNVYGGGNLGDVGRINRTLSGFNYKWTDDAVSTSDPADKTYDYNNTGSCKVQITGGTIGANGISTANHASGHVFGAGKGATSSFYCEKGMVYTTSVTISKGTVYGNVYGGGEVGRVESDAIVSIDGTNENDTEIKGGVFGAGAGVETHGYSALLRGDATVTVQGKAKVGMNVYGGGEIASVGRFKVENSLPTKPLSGGTCKVTIQGDAQVGTGSDGGSVYGACKGVEPGNYSSATHVISDGSSQGFTGANAEADYLAFLKTLALTSNTDVTIDGNASVNGSIYGGGRRGVTLGSVAVNMTGGTVTNDVYGGGALADTNTGNWHADYGEVAGLTTGDIVTGYYTRSGEGTPTNPYIYNEITAANTPFDAGTTYYSINTWAHVTKKSALYTTNVSLTGGVVGNAYGGALGSSTVAANVWGDVLVSVNGTAFTHTNETFANGDGSSIPKTGRVFGCNNLNGSPKGDVTVHVYQTVGLNSDGTINNTKPTKGTNTYELSAVYGGGNQAEYYPVRADATDATEANHVHTNVIIDGCTQTSIGTVYGGGNAASTPSTCVTVNGAYEIGEVFGGGNGKDKVDENTANPGAHVGFHKYTSDSDKASQKYGFGKAQVNIGAGVIHAVYGGSNAKGNVRDVAIATLDHLTTGCEFAVGKAYGGGKAAEMDGRAVLQLGCIPTIDEVYGGAESANIHNDVELTITNGTYKRIFGGNNKSGNIDGAITINIEETGCTPIVIGQIFAGGNEAAYTTPSGKADPVINVKSFTSIGQIFGGGFGPTAVLTGNPTIYIDEIVGDNAAAYTAETFNYDNDTEDTSDDYTVVVPAHTVNTIGTIGDVYGGGYGADVVGDVTVNIGTQEKIELETTPHRSGITADANGKYTVTGVDIARNVYGGGYGAATTVTGNVAVNVGGEKTESETTTFIGGTITIGESVYGGSALGAVNATRGTSGLSKTADATTAVTLKKGTISGAVYGGGMGDLATLGSGHSDVTAQVFGDAKVTLYGDVIAGGIYGGCNLNGTMLGKAQLDLLGGTVGAAFDATNVPTEIPNIVFGGGLGAKTSVVGDVTVNVNKSDKTPNGVAIYSNVYGGSKNGSVAVANVNLEGGVIWGDVFGGGYETASNATAATNATVTLNGTAFGITYVKDDNNNDVPMTGRIFGCNNLQGSPTGNVIVNVEKTVAGNVARTAAGTNGKPQSGVTPTYELQAVYGGGNLAPYNPTVSGAKSQVNIRGCNDTSIEYVYGGGNAAAMGSTTNTVGSNLNVEGAYEIGFTFGGGNGSDRIKSSTSSTGWTENPGANVNGNATSTLVGGFIHNVFGGSNTLGTITGEAKIDIDENGNTCDLITENIYGAGMNADVEGDVNLRIGCLADNVKNVYGGAMAAKINGNVTLTITSGVLENVYGGNNESGSISGKITVNIEETDECKPIVIGNLYGGGNLAAYPGPYFTNNNPGIEVNVKSFTSIGNVYGGGRGSTAVVTGNTEVNINEVKGRWAGTARAAETLTINGVQVTIPEHKANEIGAIGNVYGGGDAAAVVGDATVNIGTETKTYFVTEPVNYRTAANTPLTPVASGDHKGLYEVTVEGAKITGNVYGGGNLADVGQYHEVYDETTKATTDVIDVTGNTYVNICAKDVSANDNPVWQSVAVGTSGVTISGKVFGGGKGIADSFRCGKAMVTGGTNIHIGNGTIGNSTTGGNVYGGGEIGRVEGNAVVMIGLTPGTTGTSAPHIMGNVFGAGSGVKTHGYSALLRGKTEVTIQSDAKVDSCVYGGGEIASVGRFKVKTPTDTEAPSWLPVGMPYSLWDATTESGKCTVIVQGNAEIGPDNMTMTAVGGPVNSGHVFGAGKGVTPEVYSYTDKAHMPKRMMAYNSTTYPATGAGTSWDYVSETDHNNVWEYFSTEAKYLTFVETMALVNKTDVTIDGNAFVKGSVYGGSENGQVKHDTHVTIKNGQIGCGKETTTRYADGVFIDPAVTPVTTSVATCDTWTYVDNGYTYDKFADENGNYSYTGKYEVIPTTEQLASSEGGRLTATDGHTFYGNVFGGGSGYYPYAPGKWHSVAGMVGGDTQVDIEGGHILSNVYGGNEQTDVGSYSYTTDSNGAPHREKGGTCTVNMKGGTVGVPRTESDIKAKPVIGNLFGAGKGDKRVLFNTKTNVNKTFVNVTGGIVYGSVFGGGEDGHVLEDATTTIEQASGKTITIGSTGESGADGNVFGGGRGSETALTAGVVGGNVSLTINSGNILGSVYGGGRLASVGTNFVNPNNADLYGKLQDDTSTKTHGHITVTVNDGTIGTNTENSTGIGGNIYGGSKGTTADFRLGIARSTTINMTGGIVYASVYGGGELAQVVGSHTTDGKALGTEINISGGTIGISGKGGATWGNVYGGGKGNLTNPEAGLIKTNTLVKVENGTNTTPTIYHNIYGGGAYGSVGDITYSTASAPATYVPNHASVLNMPMSWAENTGKAEVYVYGGTIGVNGKENGMVFASSRGDVAAPEGVTTDNPYGTDVDPNDRLAWVHDTKLVIGAEGKSPIVKGSAYGSGENGHVFGNSIVEIHNGTIGVTTNDDLGGPDYRLRGNVYGGGCGEDTYEVGTEGNKKEYFNPLAGIVRGTATVTIDGGQVVHNVYGAGALGSAGGKTTVTIAGNATIGVDGAAGGSVFGAARGKEGVTVAGSNLANSPETEVNINGGQIWNSVYGGGEAGNVKQNVVVNVTGGTVAKDVYGGGALADTQTSNWNPTGGTWAEGKTSASHTTIVNVLGGSMRDVYGGGLGRVASSGVTAVEAFVYGDTRVNLNELTINDDTKGAIVNRIFGGNNLNGTPKGNATVHVFATQAKDKGTIKAKNARHTDLEAEDATTTYDVVAVYGGGNEAAYVPVSPYTTSNTSGSKTQVIIEGCDYTSIKTVYGGGNAASVPETNVEIKSAYEIENVFGGGNGKDKKSDGSDNPGADIGQYNNGTGNVTYGTGNANTLLEGGVIHETYGGSNQKGEIKGSINQITDPDASDCELVITKVVGAGKYADIDGDVNLVLSCQPAQKIDLLFAGADEANVNGNISLTITNGNFGKVFGGNNLGGAVKGKIVVNVEETGCQPIKIDELYLGGNEAAYSVFGYYESDEIHPVTGKKILKPRESATDSHLPVKHDGTNYASIGAFTNYDQPILNVISCTSIGKVFGGGYGVGGDMYADPTVNINMIPGAFANNISESADNPYKLGSIGDVYGGGNAADVIGNPTVNIGTAETVTMTSVDDDTNTADIDEKHPVVKGAYITGNVFGGGMGKDDTFTCEKAMVGIDGDGVAHPDGGTTVNIYNGTVLGNVYGGGEVGRVEKNTTVTIGLGDGVATGTPTSAPVIKGSVFGGGKGLETHGYSALVRGNPTVTVQGNAKVRGNVYGGGQIASVARYNVAKTDDEGAPYGVKKDEPYALKTNTSGFCSVTIKGYAEIGPETIGEEKTTSVGHVFGAGKGILPGGDYAFVQGTTKRMVAVRDSEGHITDNTWDVFASEADYITFVKTLALASQTNVIIDGNAKVKGSVFGGSESGFVQFDANVNVLGGTIGVEGKGGADFGNVYGGGKGDVEYTGTNHNYITAGIVKGNTKVAVSQASGKTTKILHNVYGGGAYGTVGEFEYDATTGLPTARKTYTIGTEVHNTTGGKAEIYITGGTIGTNGNENGMVFGSSRGDVGAAGSIHDKAAWVYDTHVAIGDTTENATITTATPLIKGSVYGGGENGHNFHNSYVRINGGTIGIPEGEAIGSYTAGGASYPYRGNVYGGGCGTDKYYSTGTELNDGNGDTYNAKAGIVQGNAIIHITAGTIVHNVYGAGAMGSVGTTDVANSGKTTIDISGGTIGVSGTVGDGNVFGAARGDKNETNASLAQVRETSVTVSSGQVMGNVYGGGEVGNVGRFTNQDPVSVGNYNWDTTSNANSGLCTVTINGGKIGPDGVALSKDHGNVFGGGKGVSNTFECEKAMVYKTNVTISNGSIVNGTVYGGGEVGRVENNTVVTIGTENGTDEPEIKGNVFAAGAGTKTHGYSALVRGTSSVTVQGKAKVLKNIYGGGEEASVGRYKVKTSANAGDADVPESLPYGMPAVLLNGGTSTVVIQDQAVIGTEGVETTGHVYGAGQGVNPYEVAYTYESDATKPSRMISGNTWEFFANEAAYLQFVETLALTGKTDVTIDEGATIRGSVFGGSESGFVYHDTDVKIKNGTIKGDAFGGGRGLASFAEAGRVSGNTSIAISDGAVQGNVYGGGNLGDVGTIKKNADYNYKWKNSDCNGNINATGNDNIAENNKITGTNKNTGICKVTISGGTIGVDNPAEPTKHGNVFGAGQGLATTWWCEKAIAFSTDVSITKGTVKGNVYGGGQIGRVEDDAKVTIGSPNGTDAPVIKGDVFGAGAGLATHGYSALVRGNADVTVQGKAQIGGSVYGGGETASVGRFTVVGGLPKHPDSGGTCTVIIKDNAAITGEVFGACKGVTPAYVASGENRSKSMQLYSNHPSDASMWSHYNNDENSPFIWRYYPDEAAYLAFLETLALTSNTDVTVGEENSTSGPTIAGSVYGGGQRGITLGSVKVDMLSGTVNKDVYGGGALANTNKGNWDDDKGTWADGKTSADYTTTVNLMGGLIGGDAYGGGLGQLGSNPIEAKVYGDVFVNLGKADAEGKPDLTASATAFNVTLYKDEGHTDVVKSGRVFGCNNLNGSPQGNVTVTVNKTVEGNTPRTAAANLQNTGVAHTYELANVYGGGNLANYTSTTGKVKVIINSCDVSVQEVYGGGNAAAVPATDVLVRGAYEIAQVFGGGNGEDDYYLNGQWNTNPGANVGGNATTLLTGGYIHEAYGASNSKGVISGNINISKGSGGECDLNVVELYGAGKDADVEGDLIMVMGCSETRTEAVYGCARNANVKGNVELTITSGEYGKIFGGNNESGAIFGHIVVNIEEDGCSPIIIDELYGCGNDAAYSTYGYYQDGIIAGTDGKPKYVARSANDTHEAVSFEGKPHTVPPYADPEVNVISATRIGKVFGGGYGAGATVYGNPKVNINMIKGAWAGKTYGTGEGAVAIPDQLGAIGDVYGGGNEANVEGNTFVNIGTLSKVQLHKSYDTTTGKYTMSEEKDVLGANITGNVFGGGKGKADTFTCEKAMVNGDKGTNITIGNGTVKGTVYGGGEIGRVENNAVVTIGLEEGTSAPVIEGNVFGAGKGVSTHGYSALVRGNTFVTVQGDAKVLESIFGGGEIASVGKYNIADEAYHAAHPEVEVGMPYSLVSDERGICKVIVRGNAEIGPDNMQMKKVDGSGKPLPPDDTGHVFGAGKGILPYEGYAADENPWRMMPGDIKETYSASDADAYLKFVESLGLVTQTEVVISGNAFVKGSVYGGSENGHVQHNTQVTIAGGQIGNGNGVNRRYTDAEWASESLAGCAHWDYDSNDGAPYDLFAKYSKTVDGKVKYYYDEACTQTAEGGSEVGKDGHTYYGNVFGGGSGVIPYAPGKWHRASGSVGGNTKVDITGGHILTSVYGGNEQTDVGTYKPDAKGALVIPVDETGKCTINMTGGTIGVPRTVQEMMAHPVACYLFGAGKGDQRIFFNTWTNVINTEVNISGNARIYGSTFGGGEDGHVINDAVTNISGNAIIGTTGTSYVDGNVFGGGRGFSGDAQTAGTVGGNIDIKISGGKMLGSIYGGGRLASVGTLFTDADDPNYGNFVEDTATKTYGHVTIDISGGIIGNDLENIVPNATNIAAAGITETNVKKWTADGEWKTWKNYHRIPNTEFELYDSVLVGNTYTYKYQASHTKGGNVFGGSMGRLTLLDGKTINPIWPKMAQTKSSAITIRDAADIKRNVYGGGELGTVNGDAVITMTGGKVGRDIYGGGYGSDDHEIRTTIYVNEPNGNGGYNKVDYTFTPMQFAGCVGKSTTVNISGGLVRKSVYGGGEMASVGVMDYKNIVYHDDETKGFALSWPCEIQYIPGYEGDTHVNITGGRIGVTKDDDDIDTDNGDVCGGGKGIAGDYKDYVFCANVGSSEVTINYPTTIDPATYLDGGDCITGAVYGGAENGHVMGDSKLILKGGLIGHSIYGGGSGKGKFKHELLKIGKTKGSTNPNDYFIRDNYSITAGKVFGNTSVEMSGGLVVRNVYGGGNMGSVGKGNYAGGADDYSTAGYGEKVDGNLWDGSNKFSTAFLNSGKCTVKITGGTIGYIDATNPSKSVYSGLPYGNVFGGCRGESAPNIVESPRYLYSPEFFVGYANETSVTIEGNDTKILGSVYGGGMDGHVRRDASVTINGGTIGSAYTSDEISKVGTSDLNHIMWLHRGNVYGAGSGMGKYKYDFDYDGKYTSTVDYNNGRSVVSTKEEDYSTSAGSVTRFTTVNINGGTIYHNVYGGGSLSSVGAPKIGQSYLPYLKDDATHSTEVGKQSLNEVTISGGNIGDATSFDAGYGGHVFGASRGDATLSNPSSFAQAVWTDVNMKGGTVLGDVYGGGEVGSVRQGTEVTLTGGTVKHDVYGGGKGTSEVAANVGGDVLVDLNPIAESAKGCVVKGNIFGANNVNGSPEGHVKVHVHGTQNENTAAINAKVDGTYDVTGVFGGGNNADYVPTDAKQSTEVIIEGCDLTSIYEVYGGGYGAASPGTNVLIKGTKIIDNVFGGGYGAGTNNPGANVGYRTGGTTAYGLGDTNTKTAVVQLMAGHVNNVYGGSNTKGDIRGGASITNLANSGEPGTCSSLDVGKVYGGGKDAEMKGGAEIVLGCMPDDWIEEIYAGAENADVGSDVSLTITSGKFGRVFGGNKTSGRLHGSITVNIEENPDCDVPIIIGELYGGGNEAPYSIYGYKDEKDKNGKWIPRQKSDYDAMTEAQKEAEGIRSGAHNNPQVNVRSFTSIGNIFGGGYGEDAVMVGSPMVNINEVILLKADGTPATNGYDPETDSKKPALIDGTNVKLYKHEAGKMGVIGTVFGGGNAAKVIGDTHVNIGTTAQEPFESLRQADGSVPKKPVVGADIRGNVYGGGNNAAVTGDPKVVIGQRKE